MSHFKFMLMLLLGTHISFAMDDNPYDMSEDDLVAYAIHVSENQNDHLDQFTFLQVQEDARNQPNNRRLAEVSYQQDIELAHRLQQEDAAAQVHQEQFNASEMLAFRMQVEEELVRQQQIEANEAFIRHMQVNDEMLAGGPIGASLGERAAAARAHILADTRAIQGVMRHENGVINWNVLESESPFVQRSIDDYINAKGNAFVQEAARGTLRPIFEEYAPYEFLTSENAHFLANSQGIHMLDGFYAHHHGTVLGLLRTLNLGMQNGGGLLSIEGARRIMRDILLEYGAVDAGTLDASLNILFDGFLAEDENTELALRMIAMARDLEELGARRMVTHLLRIPENITEQGGCFEGRRNRNLLATLAILSDLGLRR